MRRLALTFLVMLTTALPAQAWEQRMVPVTVDGETVRLSTIVYRPAADGPFPTLVFLHGSTGYGGDSERFAWVQEFAAVARYFVARGWAVVLPSRRGRGGSEGLYDEGFRNPRALGYSCDPAQSLPGAERGLRDVASTMDAIREWPIVDRQRIVIGGVSRGGILATLYAGTHPDSVVGVINYVGGWAGSCAHAQSMRRTLFRRAAAYPGTMLWLYSDGDENYTLDQIRDALTQFREDGGMADYHDDFVPAVGHALSSHPNLWHGPVDQYLANLGLPHIAAFAEDTPLVPQVDTPADEFVGRWMGAWFGVAQTVLTVRSVEADGTADIVYFFRGGNSFLKGTIADGVLRLHGGTNKVRFFHMPDGLLRGEVEGADGGFGTAMLTKRE